MTDKTHLVVGAGEVGTALHRVLHGVIGHRASIRDIESTGTVADVLHVCIPWSDTFVETVQEYAAEHEADLIIIHSTVPVGTCDPQGWVHSPIRGRHPELAEGIRRFRKHVGGARALEAINILWEDARIWSVSHEKAATTEAGKLWELVQFGIQVMMEKDIHNWCQESGLDSSEVYMAFARTYNDGYMQLGESRFVRPTLEHMPGDEIGGHCVTQNAPLLDHPWAKMVADR